MQSTVKNKVSFKGIGVHSGKSATCTIHPAPDNHGIVFVRTDAANKPKIRADVSKVHRTDMSTTLANNGVIVATVEHLMAALVGMGIDNALVEIDGPEVPIMDGSAREFALGIQDAGVFKLEQNRKVMRLRRKVSVKVGDKWIVAKPASDFSIKGSIEFKHKVIGAQLYKASFGKNFVKDIAGARTFGFLKEVEYLHKKGLALGGSLDNAVVLDESRVLNPEGLRYKNEFVRHKVLDAIGDLGLLGMKLIADVHVHKAGHALHVGFLQKLLSDTANYEIVEQNEKGLVQLKHYSGLALSAVSEAEEQLALMTVQPVY